MGSHWAANFRLLLAERAGSSSYHSLQERTLLFSTVVHNLFFRGAQNTRLIISGHGNYIFGVHYNILVSNILAVKVKFYSALGPSIVHTLYLFLREVKSRKYPERRLTNSHSCSKSKRQKPHTTFWYCKAEPWSNLIKSGHLQVVTMQFFFICVCRNQRTKIAIYMESLSIKFPRNYVNNSKSRHLSFHVQCLFSCILFFFSFWFVLAWEYDGF